MKLLYFLLGIIFIQWIFPLLDTWTALLMVRLEKRKGKVSVDLAQYNKQIRDIAECEEINTHAIGFQVSPAIEEDDFEEDEE